MTVGINYQTGEVLIDENDTHATPPSNKVKIYARSNGFVYSKDDTGLETLMSGIPDAQPSNGFEDVTFTTSKAAGDNTGLASTTAYTQDVSIDGAAPVTISFTTGGGTTTYTDLLAFINADINPAATAFLIDGNLRIQSASTGVTSSISIGVGDIFSNLTDFHAIRGPVVGENADGMGIYFNGSDWTYTPLLNIYNPFLNAFQIGLVNEYPTDNSNGFDVNIYGSNGGSEGNTFGGNVAIFGGTAFGTTTSGGTITITGGYGSGSNYSAGGDNDISAGGGVIITGGTGFNDVSGAISINVPTPTGGFADANGNHITLSAGGANSAGGAVNGGNIFLTPGAEAGGGDNGNVFVGTTIDITGTNDGGYAAIPFTTTTGTPTTTPNTNAGGFAPMFVQNDTGVYTLWVYIDGVGWKSATLT